MLCKRRVVLLALSLGLFVFLVLGLSLFAEARQIISDSRCSFNSFDDVKVNLDKEKILDTADLLDSTTKEITESLDEYRKDKSKSDERRLKRLLASRKKALIEAVNNDPRIISVYMLPEDARKELSKLGGNCVESLVDIEGRLEILHYDYFEEGIGRDEYVLVTDDNQRFNLHPVYGLDRQFLPGSRIRVRGLRIDNEIVFDSKDSLNSMNGDLGGYEILQESHSEQVFGDQKVLVLMVNFQGG